MDPKLITLCGAAQLFILFSQSQWIEGAVVGAICLTILAAFAYTRLKWDAHLDMFLAMLGPGGLGMLIGGNLAGGDCHTFTWSGFLGMSAGMAIAGVPLCWFTARCFLKARGEGRGALLLWLDMAGMEVGMLIAHLPAMFIHVTDGRAIWLNHGMMLVMMSAGMAGSRALEYSWRASRKLATAHR